MTRMGHGLLLGYLFLAHALGATIYWQNNNLHATVADLESVQPSISVDSQYQERVIEDLIRAYGAKPGGVHLLGDSIIARSGTSRVDSDTTQNWGLDGDTSDGLRYRVLRYPFLAEASAIVIHIGVNDALQRRTERTAANVSWMVETLSVHAPVVLSGILPVDERVVERSLNDKLEALNDRFESICERYENCSFASAWRRLADLNGQLDPRYHTGDGIHLSPAGYEIFGAILRSAK